MRYSPRVGEYSMLRMPRTPRSIRTGGPNWGVAPDRTTWVGLVRGIMRAWMSPAISGLGFRNAMSMESPSALVQRPSMLRPSILGARLGIVEVSGWPSTTPMAAANPRL